MQNAQLLNNDLSCCQRTELGNEGEGRPWAQAAGSWLYAEDSTLKWEEKDVGLQAQIHLVLAVKQPHLEFNFFNPDPEVY